MLHTHLVPHRACCLAKLLQEAAEAAGLAQPHQPRLTTNVPPPHGAAAAAAGQAGAISGRHRQLLVLAARAQQHTHLQG